MEEILYELEYNTDYQDDILKELNKLYNLNRLVASDGREALKKLITGVTVIPLSFGKYTSYEVESLRLLDEIGTWNQEEFVAIGDLPKENAAELSKLIGTGTPNMTEEDILSNMNKNRQQNIEKSIGETEEKKDAIQRQNTLINRVDGIYRILSNDLRKKSKKEDKGIIKTASNIADSLSDLGGIKDLVSNETVNISKRSIKDLCKCIGDDDFDFPRRRKKRGRRNKRGRRVNKRNILKKGAKKGKTFFKSGKNLLKGSIRGITGRTLFAGLASGIGGAILGDMLMPDELGSATLEDNGMKMTDEWAKEYALLKQKEEDKLRKNTEDTKNLRLPIAPHSDLSAFIGDGY